MKGLGLPVKVAMTAYVLSANPSACCAHEQANLTQTMSTTREANRMEVWVAIVCTIPTNFPHDFYFPAQLTERISRGLTYQAVVTGRWSIPLSPASTLNIFY